MVGVRERFTLTISEWDREGSEERAKRVGI